MGYDPRKEVQVNISPFLAAAVLLAVAGASLANPVCFWVAGGFLVVEAFKGYFR